MNHEDSETALRAHMTERFGESLRATPRQAFDALVAFYREIDIAGVLPDEPDGDMLLFQWGTYDRGEGASFELGLARQMIVGDGDDDDVMTQIHVTFRFPPDATTARLGEGSHWCMGREDLDELAAFLRDVDVMAAFGDATGVAPELRLEHV